MKDPSPPPRTPYRRSESGDSWNAPQHRRGGRSDATATLPVRRWPRRLLIAANVMVALTIIGAASAYGYVNWRFSQIHSEHLSSLAAPASGGGGGGGGGKPFTMLVVGSDSRAALASTPGNAAFGGAANVGG